MRAMPFPGCRGATFGRNAQAAAFVSTFLGISAGFVSFAGFERSAHAVDPMVGLRSLAMGDSMRGTATGAEGVLLNPSGLALERKFDASAFYSLRAQSLGHFLHASVSDSVTQQYIAVGLYYNYWHETPHFAYALGEGGASTRAFIVDGYDVVRQGTEAGTVLAIPFSDRFALGATLKYAYLSYTSQLHPGDVPDDFAYGQNPAINGDHVVDMGSPGNVVSFDIGATVRLFSELRLGVVGQNLWAHGVDMPTRLGIGLSYKLSETLLFAADAVIDFTGTASCVAISMQNGLCIDTKANTTFRIGGGMEYVAGGKVPLRVGYMYDSWLNAHHVSGGLGYLDLATGFGIDLSLRQQVSAGTETVALLGLRIIKN